VADPQNPAGETPNEDDADALGGGREQDDQHADDGENPEARKLRAEARRYRLERNEAQAKLKERDDRDKTEMQKLIERAETAEGRAGSAEMLALKYEIAADHGIPLKEAKRLQGNTREALGEDAKAYAKDRGISPDGERPDFSVQRPKTMNDVIRQAAGR
jgi:hypothetical protein